MRYLFPIVLILALAAVVAFGALLFQVFARVSGWNKLAGLYPAGPPPEGQRLARQTVQVGPVRFRRSTTVVISPQGLYLAALVNPPLLIPWSEVREVRATTLYWQRAMTLRIGNPLVGPITVGLVLYTAILPTLLAITNVGRQSWQKKPYLGS